LRTVLNYTLTLLSAEINFPGMNVIEIDSLTKSYGHLKAIDKLSLDVSQGDIFGFIGPNGAGKSTTIRILLNLIFPTSGTATIFGLNVVDE
jgi:ABC-2 type transport system ATP-binding protein